jgi:serine/threonine-protein kinase RsbW
MYNKQVELQVPADTQYVGLARLVVTAAARQAGMSDERIEDLKIAVSEATANAVNAHRRYEEQSPVVLRFGPTSNGSFAVTVADAGPGFDPAPPDLNRDWTFESGLGLLLIRELADDVQFVRGGGMRVHMSFKIGLDSSDS